MERELIVECMVFAARHWDRQGSSIVALTTAAEPLHRSYATPDAQNMAWECPCPCADDNRAVARRCPARYYRAVHCASFATTVQYTGHPTPDNAATAPIRNPPAAATAPMSGWAPGDIIYHSGASLALELATVNTGMIDGGKMLEGGWLYLVGEPSMFWSAMINRRSYGRICPPAPEAGETFENDTLAGRELNRMVATVEGAVEKRGINNIAVKAESRSMAAVAITRLPVPFAADGTMKKKPASSAAAGGAGATEGAAATASTDGEKDKDAAPAAAADGADSAAAAAPAGDEIATKAEEIPDWWLEAEKPWDEMLTRCSTFGRAPCMFTRTPAGCVAGKDKCYALHDARWKDVVDASKTVRTDMMKTMAETRKATPAPEASAGAIVPATKGGAAGGAGSSDAATGGGGAAGGKKAAPGGSKGKKK